MNPKETKNIGGQDTENENVYSIEPPAVKGAAIKDPMKLIYEILFMIIAFFPLIIWSIIEYYLAKRKSIKGKVVLVTGSGRGLGRGFVEEFARLGCKVACVDIDESLNEETVKEVEEKFPECCVKAYKCNVGLPHEVKYIKEAVIKDFGQVNVLVHNAAIIGGLPITDFEDDYLLNFININLISHFLILREFLPDMIERNEGHYVAIGSVGSFCGIKGASFYIAAKHGILGLMKCLQIELEANPKNQVQSSIVCPYFVNTSATYSSYWRLRLPEMSIKYTVREAINGILKNRKIITIPSIYYPLMFLNFLPDKFLRLISRIFYVEISIPPMEIQSRAPLYQHMSVNKMVY